MTSTHLLRAVTEWRPKVCRGNHKLGRHIWTWSLPAEETCPGATAECRKACYATKGFYLFDAVTDLYRRNEAFSRTKWFVPWMTSRLVADAIQTLRIHAAGDFYDAAYVDKWRCIAKKSPCQQFFGYTRSWRERSQRRSLRQLSRLSNMTLWWSADRETGRPPLSGPVAYMASDDADAAAAPIWTDLVFRVDTTTVLRRSVDGSPVCPHETGLLRSKSISCSTCRVCFDPEQAAKHRGVVVRQPGHVIND